VLSSPLERGNPVAPARGSASAGAKAARMTSTDGTGQPVRSYRTSWPTWPPPHATPATSAAPPSTRSANPPPYNGAYSSYSASPIPLTLA
jgi:hypothetical protein